MATVRLRNVNPLGAVDLPLLQRTLAAFEEFDCPEALAGRGPSVLEDGTTDLGEGLLAQVGNYELVPVPVDEPAAKKKD
jgi:hypothetical protein